jgi:hypothetical protein
MPDAREERPVATVQLWRVGEVAALYGVDESTVHRWERTGTLRAARRDPGGTKYWLASEVLADVADPPVAPEPAPQRPVGELVAATRRRRQRRAG